MKKLRITVNNKVYDVTVQVLEDDELNTGDGFVSPLPRATARAGATALASPHAAPATAAGTADGAPGASATPQRARAGHSNGSAVRNEPNAIFAPIGGIVQKIFVQSGSHVEAKAPVMMLDAMKMDTYIYAPRSGDIAEVAVAQGASVQVGDCLIRYRAEG